MTLEQKFVRTFGWLHKKFPHNKIHRTSTVFIGELNNFKIWKKEGFIIVDLPQIKNGHKFISFKFTDKAKAILDFNLLL